MGMVDKLLWQAFGVPTGLLGRMGGKIMAGRRQRKIAAHVAELLEVRRGDQILEIGFGPGVGIQYLHERLSGEGLIVGIDPSEVMLQMARSLNAEAIESGTVTLFSGTVEKISYDNEFFDKAYAMNSFHLWPDKPAGLSEVRWVLKRDGQLVLSFYGPAQKAITPESVREQLEHVGFREIDETRDRDSVIYVVARK